MTTTIPTEIATFAAQVRAAMVDLPPAEVEELTEGLEADLAEAYAEDLARELPDPRTYAGELRNAAGLPAPEDAGGRTTRGSRLRAARSSWADLVRVLREHPASAKGLEVLGGFRPLWWVVRGWAASWLAVKVVTGSSLGVLPGSALELAVLVPAVLGSVALGLWAAPPAARVLVVAGNVLAAGVLLAAYDSTGVTYYGYPTDSGGYVPDLTGVYLDGNQVSNVYAYDAAGQPLPGVQLFDQDGRPLATSVEGGSGCFDPDCLGTGLWVPAELVTGQEAYNVYPLAMVEAEWYEGVLQPKEGAVPVERGWPFAVVPAVEPAAANVG